MSFMYPRVVKILRPRAQTGVGERTTYAADQASAETTIKQGIPASIQAKSSNERSAMGLPGDGAISTWRVLTPRGALRDSDVLDRDIIQDDLGRRFQVVANYSNSLGADFIVKRLEA